MTARLLNGPDDAVRTWWTLCAREETASGRDPFLMKGSVPAEACGNCGHGDHHEVPAKRGHGWVDRCRFCGTVWKFAIEYVVRGTVQVTRHPHGIEHRLVTLADLEVCVYKIPRADALVYGRYLTTDRSYAFVAEEANEIARASGGAWVAPIGGYTEHKVRTAVRRARRILRKALEERSLISKRITVLMLNGSEELLDALGRLPATVLVPADPARWAGLLQEFEARPERLRDSANWAGLRQLSLGSTRKLGEVYREVPMSASYPPALRGD